MIRQFICPQYREYIRAQLKKEYENGALHYGDNTVREKSFSSWSGPILENLLFSKIESVSHYFSKELKPYYAYCRIYKKGSVLHPHNDIPELEYTVTINIAHTHMYPIYLVDNGVKDYVYLEPGDALLFRGDRVIHGRDVYDGDECMQVFLHYIDANGPHKHIEYSALHRYEWYCQEQRAIVHRADASKGPLYIPTYVKVLSCDAITDKDICSFMNIEAEPYEFPHSKSVHDVQFLEPKNQIPVIADCVVKNVQMYQYLLNMTHDITPQLNTKILFMKKGSYINLCWFGAVTGCRMCGFVNLTADDVELSICNRQHCVTIPQCHMAILPNMGILNGSAILPVTNTVVLLVVWW